MQLKPHIKATPSTGGQTHTHTHCCAVAPSHAIVPPQVIVLSQADVPLCHCTTLHTIALYCPVALYCAIACCPVVVALHTISCHYAITCCCTIACHCAGARHCTVACHCAVTRHHAGAWHCAIARHRAVACHPTVAHQWAIMLLCTINTHAGTPHHTIAPHPAVACHQHAHRCTPSCGMSSPIDHSVLSVRRHALAEADNGGGNLNKGKEGGTSDDKYAPVTVRCALTF